MHDVRDGWVFARQPEGRVRLWKQNGFGIVSEWIEMSPEEWAAAVAAVSLSGDLGRPEAAKLAALRVHMAKACICRGKPHHGPHHADCPACCGTGLVKP